MSYMFYVNHPWMRTVLLPKTQPIINLISWWLMLLDCFEGTCHCWKSRRKCLGITETLKRKKETGVTQKGECELHFSSPPEGGALLVISTPLSHRLQEWNFWIQHVQSCKICHKESLLHLPCTVNWCILGHGWILTRQMACKKPNRFRKKSNKPRKAIKSNVRLIYTEFEEQM